MIATGVGESRAITMTMTRPLAAAALAAVSAVVALPQSSARQPNIVFFLADDQDAIIGGWDQMRKTKALLGEGGATFSNAFTHTPICAVSRSELQSGRYLQNIKSSNLPTPVSGSGHGSGNGGQHHVNYTGLVAPVNFGTHLHAAGYTTGVFGKWMNEYNGELGPPSDPAKLAVAPGWDRWFAGMGYGNLTYLDNESPTGTYVACPYPGTCAQAAHQGYTTAILGNKTIEWIRKVATDTPKPFFAYVGATAPHLPDQPPPWYCPGGCPSVWPTAHAPKTPPTWYKDCANVTSPRLPNFNKAGPGFHAGIAGQAPFSDEDIRYVDKLALMRCLTLLGVDDTVAEISAELDALGVSDNTYLLYSSDHGYNLGHHRLPDNKFNSYLHDLRVPLLVRGPGIKHGLSLHHVVTLVDLAPTFLGLAGIPTPGNMDGRSLVPLLIDGGSGGTHRAADTAAADAAGAISGAGAGAALPASVAAHLAGEARARTRAATQGGGVAAQPWRDHSLAVWYNCGFSMLNHSEDDASNTFLAMYLNSSTHGLWKYALFDPTGKQTGFAAPDFFELFDLANDPHETTNLYYSDTSGKVTAELKAYLNRTIRVNYACKGAACP